MPRCWHQVAWGSRPVQRRWQKSRSPGRARSKPSSHCAGKAGVFPLNLYARVRFCCALCTRDRGCSEHPVFPAPSTFVGGKFKSKPRAKPRREIAKVCRLFEIEIRKLPSSLPSAQLRTGAGTHNHRPELFYEVGVACLFQQQRPRRMGPCAVRNCALGRDDSERSEIRCRSHTFGLAAPRDRETASVQSKLHRLLSPNLQGCPAAEDSASRPLGFSCKCIKSRAFRAFRAPSSPGETT